ncbi:RNA 2',3'-cyclic phosphodiesterase [Novilysobacter selenitireducens]|uniref:RNA 2',3'-cyclic phosphodiesterase n=1 Tax=Novilysobacter selenitireducens TaxID=2872639 RepID=A0ABS7T7S3_9GAMM|nr:RNA 2',3'-cyclic phosphodiesterase [Lysobacter selenitireducens]MBZ4039920.1 RNA 2',3'-cyclic phosphodiesterase [Lysobacter selenitireducens]
MHQPDPAGRPPTPDPRRHQRLFFALLPDASTREAMARGVDTQLGAGISGRRTAPALYHLTLSYLGEFDNAPALLVDAACRAAATVCVPAFDLRLSRLGSFRQGRGWLWWLGPDATPPGLQALWQVLDAALLGARIRRPPDTAFRPHVTVLRGCDRAPPADTLVDIVWLVREFALVSSQAGAYRSHGRWPLGDGRRAVR